MQRITVGRVIASIVFWLAIAPLPAAGAEDYELGVILSLTGGGAVWSHESVEAIQMAADEINSEGGLLKKHPIHLTIVDDEAKPERLAAAGQGPGDQNQGSLRDRHLEQLGALAIKPIFADAKVLHIASISNSEDITRLNPSPYMYSVVPNTYMLAKAQVLGIAGLAREKGWKSYATITSDYAFGRSIQGNVVAMLKASAPDVELRKEVWVPLSETQWCPTSRLWRPPSPISST